MNKKRIETVIYKSLLYEAAQRIDRQIVAAFHALTFLEFDDVGGGAQAYLRFSFDRLDKVVGASWLDQRTSEVLAVLQGFASEAVDFLKKDFRVVTFDICQVRRKDAPLTLILEISVDEMINPIGLAVIVNVPKGGEIDG